MDAGSSEVDPSAGGQTIGQWVKLPGTEVEISALPVSWSQFTAFAEDTGRPEPVRHGGPDEAVTGVSASDAEAYARWLSEKEGFSHRLPVLEELRAFAEMEQEHLPEHFDQPQDVEDLSLLGPAYLEEWVDSCQDDDAASVRYHLHSIAAPSWLLRHRGHQAEAALVDGPHGFVTFRLVRSR